MSAPEVFSQKLQECLIKLEGQCRSEAKLELVLAINELMPEGNPDYISVCKYEPIRNIVLRIGKKKMLALIVIIVKDFCASLNVVRNMNEDQMIEAGAMLLEECGNFRIEDYVIMFSMAKRGKLIKIYDRMDMQIITQIMDEYWIKRSRAGEMELEKEINEIEMNCGENTCKSLVWNDEKGYVETDTASRRMISLAGVFEELKERMKR